MLYSRRHEAEFHLWDNDPKRRQDSVEESLDEAEKLVCRKELNDIELDPAGRSLLEAYVDWGRSRGLPDAATAKMLQDAVLEKFTSMVYLELARRGTAVVRAEQLIPVVRSNLPEILPGKLGTNPRRRPQRLEYCPGLALTPTDMRGFEVELNFDHFDHLAGLDKRRKGLKFGIGVLNRKQEKGEELDWDLVEDSGRSYFINVRPVDANVQRARIETVIKNAHRAGVDVLVLPELCLDLKTASSLREMCIRDPNHPSIIVLGSFHFLEEGQWRNRAWAILRGGSGTLFHDKLERYSYRILSDPAGKMIEEKIRTEPKRLRFYFGGTWSLTFAICLDLISDSIPSLLSDLRPGLLLVPAFSSTSHPFQSPIASLADRQQCFALLANGPVPSEDRVVGISGIPHREKVLSTVRFDDADGELPLLYVFDVAKNSWSPLT